MFRSLGLGEPSIERGVYTDMLVDRFGEQELF
jgi:hypothetical protein